MGTCLRSLGSQSWTSFDLAGAAFGVMVYEPFMDDIEADVRIESTAISKSQNANAGQIAHPSIVPSPTQIPPPVGGLGLNDS